MRAAVASATAALKAAQKSRRPELEALSLCGLRARRALPGSISTPRCECRARGRRLQGAGRFGPRGTRTADQGRHPLDPGSDTPRARADILDALALARRCGDLFGQAGALNSIALVEADRRQGAASFRPDARRVQGGGLCVGAGVGDRQSRRELCGPGPVPARTTPDARSRGDLPARRERWARCWWRPGTWPNGRSIADRWTTPALSAAEAVSLTRGEARQRFSAHIRRSPPAGSRCARAEPAAAARHFERGVRRRDRSRPRRSCKR